SLLEGLVFGRRSGLRARELAASRPLPIPAATHPRKSLLSFEGDTGKPPEGMNQEDLRRSLTSLLWYRAGVERSGPELESALDQIRRWLPYCLGAEFRDPGGWTLQNMMETAYLVARSALLREESRGVHYRSDFPAQDNERWACHQTVSIADVSQAG
ncbi:MAG TPA: L-aspartate oxidase, partial [Planctomycetota bacterium]|nr:L-aspartate oxidase [Planctomycetota bacterium]